MPKEKSGKISIAELSDHLKSSTNGLSSREATVRLERYGQNLLKSEGRSRGLSLFLKQFRSSLIYLLLVASILSFILKDFHTGLVIATILVINAGLSFYQAFKSEKAVEKLQKLVDKEVLVIRDDKQQLLSEKLLVPGDVVILKEGDVVPADIKLFEVNSLSVNESQLTGESEPVTKTSSGARSVVYAGSVIERGEAKGMVYLTANSTKLGHIAHLSSSTKRVTQFEQSLSSFSSFLVKVTLFSLAVVFVMKLIITHDTSHIGTLLIFIIALSIAVVPEALPVIVTVTLSRGALNLAKRHVIAKTLSAVEDLGNINVLCSDKTGTLTENKLTVRKIMADDQNLFKLLAIASLESLDEKRKKFQTSFDQAFLSYVDQDIQTEANGFKRLEELPFDPAARRRQVVCSKDNKTYLIEVGSVETLLELTKASDHEKYLRVIKSDGKLGLRHIGIAYKEIKYEGTFDILSHEHGLKFIGFATLEDPLRPSAKHTIKLAEKMGVAIKILSGDSREVTQYVASEVGLVSKEQVIYTGDEISQMSDEKLEEVVRSNNAFARLDPEQKYRIIKLLKREGDVVGYQGDGINDAPALKLADVAIAVSSATDVAQDSADILLLHNDLNVIVSGIRYGRSIFANINKYIRYVMVGNFGNFFALVALYLVATNLPILAIQVLISNLIGSVPLVAISTDNVSPEELASPSHYDIRSLFFISMFLGTLTAFFYLVLFALIKNQPLGSAQTGFYLFMTVSDFVVILSVRSRRFFWQAISLSKTLAIALLTVTILTIAMLYIEPTQKAFSFTPISASIVSLVLGMTLLYLVFLDITKVLYYRTLAYMA